VIGGREDVVVEVDVGPGEAGGLAGAEAEVEHDRPVGVQRMSICVGEECSCLFGCHGSAFFGAFGFGGEFDDAGDVGGDELAALCVVECAAEDAADLDERRVRHPVGCAGFEGCFDDIGGEASEACAAEVVDEDVGGPLVVVAGGGGEVLRGEHLRAPAFEEFAEGHVPVGDSFAAFDVGEHRP
jgi:hypothetical protein